MGMPAVGNGFGIIPDDWECSAKVRGGNVSAGRLYQFALAQSAEISGDGDTISATPGDAGYVFGSVVGKTAAAADRKHGIFCIAMETALDGQFAKFKVRGLVRAFVVNSANTNIAIGGETLTPTATNSLDAVSTGNTGGSVSRRRLGLALEAFTSTPSDGTTMTIYFDGWNGVGANTAAAT